MPFYEYECSACKFYVESLQKISDPPIVKCPSCGKDTMQRLISAPVFRLKGAGWYETDFKSDGENKRNLVDTGADDKQPATSSDSDEKKTRVRASKALKKVAAKKNDKKTVVKTSKAKVSKSKAKSVKKPARQAARKAPVKTKGSKKVVKKPAKKAVKKAPSKSAARKK